MTCHRSLPGLAGKRLKAIRPFNSGSESGNLLRFPTGQHFEAVISGLGEGQHDRKATANRTAYRKRVLGIVVLCSTLLLISGVAAIMIGWNVNLTRLSTVSVEATAVSPSTN
ncbi:MAG: hypothetical protein E6G71_10435 [Alphaproteobacteria bacterium]|nr:MAG: hypothetical protein E6G71_10435 [Alphaproteobacteria bacterium]